MILVVTWAAAAVCARALARRAGHRGVAGAVVAAAIAAGLLAVVPGQICRVTASLPLSMLLAALAFGAVVVVDRIAPHVPSPRPPFVAPHPIAFIVGAVVFVFVVDGALTRNFFDEDHHVPMLTVIARGIVPPVHPLVPTQVIPYHWGIDALYAQLHVAGLRPDSAIDVVTILSFPLFFCAAALAGSVIAGKPGATLGASLVPLAGSPLAWPLHTDMGVLELHVAYPARWLEWDRRPPPITADFFQHPQGLAFPLVLVVLVLFCAPQRASRTIGALLLACLSLVQAIQFLVVGFGLLAAVVVALVRSRDARAFAVDAGLLAGAFALAVLFGGFFALGASTSSTLDATRDFFGDANVGARLLHHIVAFGLPFALLPFAARGALDEPGPSLRIALVAGAVVGFVIPNVVVYAGSWDIVKLYSAGAFLAAVALVDVLVRFAQKSRARTAIVVVAAVATAWFPFAWLATRTVMQGRLGVPEKHDWRLRDDALAAGRAVDDVIPARTRVLVSDPELARQNGLLAPGFDGQRYAPMHILDYAAARTLMSAHDVAIRTLDPASLDALDVDYALFNAAESARFADKLPPPLVEITSPRPYRLYRLRAAP